MSKQKHNQDPFMSRKAADHGNRQYSPSSRGLAAIMFTDIQGYTAMMEADEAHAITLRNRHREIFEQFHTAYGGEILQYYGDGTLSVFSSAIHAVRCAIEMQLVLQQQPNIPLRIGIHIGDIIRTEEDIIGDGVNIASRIENLAIPGSVLLSGQVQHQIRNTDISTQSLGSYHVKNVSQPVDIYAVQRPELQIPTRAQLLEKAVGARNSLSEKLVDFRFITQWILVGFIAAVGGAAIYLSYGSRSKAELDSPKAEVSSRSIAVLSFDNLSGETNQQYFVDGMMDEIHTQLAFIKDLRIPSTISSSKYQESDRSVSDIARDLGVAHLLKGTVKKSRQQVRITLQLIDAHADRVLWVKQYNGPSSTDSLFEFQSLVAREVADELNAQITNEEKTLIGHSPTDSWLAYEYYLRGRERTKINAYESNQLAMEYFRRAIQEDSTFVLAYKSLSGAMVRQTNQYGQDYAWITDSAWQIVNKGLSYEPDNPVMVIQQYHLLTIMGKLAEADDVLLRLESLTGPENIEYIIHKYLQGNRKGDLAEMMKWALAWEKHDSDPHNAQWTYANIYCWLGDFPRAITLVDPADELQRLYIHLGEAMIRGEFDIAQTYAEDMIPLNPFVGRMESAEIAIRLGDYNSAIAYLEEALDSFPALPFPGSFNRSLHVLLGHSYLKQGRTSEGKELLMQVQKSDLLQIDRGDENMKYAYDLASVYAASEQKEEAIRWLRDARSKGLHQYWRLEGDPVFNIMKNDQEYLKILSEMKSHIGELRLMALKMETERAKL